MPIAILTFVNISFLAYWSFIWFRSYRKHRDKISLIVFLFVAQGLVKDLGSIIALAIAVNGLPFRESVINPVFIVRVIVTVMLISIQVIVGKINDETKDEPDNR